MDKLHLEGSFRLSNPDSGLVFHPLTPKLETKLYFIWKKYQVFTPITEKMLEKITKQFF